MLKEISVYNHFPFISNKRRKIRSYLARPSIALGVLLFETFGGNLLACAPIDNEASKQDAAVHVLDDSCAFGLSCATLLVKSMFSQSGPFSTLAHLSPANAASAATSHTQALFLFCVEEI